MGPKVSGAMWRAQARVQLAVHSSRIWGMGLPKPAIMLTHISRVTDKTAFLTSMVLCDIVDWLSEHYSLMHCQEIVFRSDSGPHYRARTVLGVVATKILQKLRTSNGTDAYGMAAASVLYGCAQHCKGDEDRYFGVLDRRLKDAALNIQITECAQVLDIFMKAAADTSVESKYKEFFVDFLPKVPKDSIIIASVHLHTF